MITYGIYILSYYILVAAGEVINGVIRSMYMNARVGVKTAKQISMISGLLICLVITFLYLPFFIGSSESELIRIGIGLSAFMLAFDVSLGRFVLKNKWGAIFNEFNIVKGNLLFLGLIIMALIPWLAYKLHRVL